MGIRPGLRRQLAGLKLKDVVQRVRVKSAVFASMKQLLLRQKRWNGRLRIRIWQRHAGAQVVELLGQGQIAAQAQRCRQFPGIGKGYLIFPQMSGEQIRQALPDIRRTVDAQLSVLSVHQQPAKDGKQLLEGGGSCVIHQQ